MHGVPEGSVWAPRVQRVTLQGSAGAAHGIPEGSAQGPGEARRGSCHPLASPDCAWLHRTTHGAPNAADGSPQWIAVQSLSWLSSAVHEKAKAGRETQISGGRRNLPSSFRHLPTALNPNLGTSRLSPLLSPPFCFDACLTSTALTCRAINFTARLRATSRCMNACATRGRYETLLWGEAGVHSRS